MKTSSTTTRSPGTSAPLAGKSTLSRLEQSWETGNRRYHQMVPNLKSLSNLFVALFLDACDTPPARITLDIDATDVETHGRQENAFFHGYYEHRCFLPFYVFCGRHLLLAQLRPANIDGGRGARNQIRRIVAMIRERWPNVAIVLRGDSGFARENLMRWCVGNAVDYVFGLARNDVLLKKAQTVRGKAAMAMIETANRSAPKAISTTSPNPEPGPGPGASSPRSNTSPDTNSAAASSSPPWIATKSRPGNSTKTPIAHAATWKTASRTANSICSPIA